MRGGETRAVTLARKQRLLSGHPPPAGSTRAGSHAIPQLGQNVSSGGHGGRPGAPRPLPSPARLRPASSSGSYLVTAPLKVRHLGRRSRSDAWFTRPDLLSGRRPSRPSDADGYSHTHARARSH